MASTQLSSVSDAARIDFRRRAVRSFSAILSTALAFAGSAPALAAEQTACGKPGQPWIKFERGDSEHVPPGLDAIAALGLRSDVELIATFSADSSEPQPAAQTELSAPAGLRKSTLIHKGTQFVVLSFMRSDFEVPTCCRMRSAACWAFC